MGPRPLQRIVAIKTALGEAMANPEFERLFMDEARIASLIQHPNVCGIQGLDEENGVTYLVMDWSDGGTLRELLDGLPGHKTDLYVAARIVADVCAGLHAAHELEGEDGEPLHVVHRDVSPQNILIASAGHVRIADFGIAKARGQLHRPTETGEMKGKLSYMAPEQVTTRDLDRRVDIFALGCVLYEATLGVRPFHGEDALSTLYQLLEQDLVLPSAVDPSYPKSLERIVVRALAKSPDDRYPTAEAMQHELRSWLAAEKQVSTERTVSAVLHQALGKKIAQRQAAVQEAMARLDSGGSLRVQSLPPTESDTVEPSIRSVETTVGASSRRPMLLWAGVVAAAAAGTAAVWIAWRPAPNEGVEVSGTPSPSTRTAPRAVAIERAPATATNVDRVKVTLTAKPEHSVLRIDGGPALSTPYSAGLPFDARPHTLELSAPGFETATRTLSFDRDRDLAITLAPLPPEPRIASSGRRPRSDETKVPEVAEATGSVLTPGPKKTPRQLDEENPF
jgi:serine/threonine-protein kinase